MFADRKEAGRALAAALAGYREGPDPVVLAIPRGGVVVGDEVARYLGAPLEVWLTRKLGAPNNPELAIGAVSSDAQVHLDAETVRYLGVSERYIEAEAARQRDEIARRLARYGRRPPTLEGRTVIVTDDGIATGATAKATLDAVRRHRPHALVLAVPVAPPETVRALSRDAEVVALTTPDPFGAVGRFYRDFTQVSDDEVLRLLHPS